MIKDLGAEWVILGHSERRAVFHEDDAVSSQSTVSVEIPGSFQYVRG